MESSWGFDERFSFVLTQGLLEELERAYFPNIFNKLAGGKWWIYAFCKGVFTKGNVMNPTGILILRFLISVGYPYNTRKSRTGAF